MVTVGSRITSVIRNLPSIRSSLPLVLHLKSLNSDNFFFGDGGRDDMDRAVGDGGRDATNRAMGGGGRDDWGGRGFPGRGRDER